MAAWHTFQAACCLLLPQRLRPQLSAPLPSPAPPVYRSRQVSAVALPHPEKAAAGQKGLNRKGYGYGGEDSYFYCSNR